MKLSNYTTSVLKNFSTINQNLVIKEGNTITTMSAMKNIVAKAEVEETFPQQIAIYDLNEFLGALSLFTSPVLDFSDNYVMISEENKPTTKTASDSPKRGWRQRRSLQIRRPVLGCRRAKRFP